MRKEQIAINFIIIFLSVSSLFAQSTKLKGDYLYRDGTGYFYQKFSFLENNIFKYKKGGDLGVSSYGNGHYKIKNDSLILNYDLSELKYESYFKAKKYFNSKDSISIKIKALDFNNQPLKKIMIYSFPEYKSSDTDENGVAHLQFKKGDYKKKIELYIDGSFWSRQIIYLDSDTNYELEVFMNKSVIEGFTHPKAIKNQIIKYKIAKQDDKNLILVHNKDTLNLIKPN